MKKMWNEKKTKRRELLVVIFSLLTCFILLLMGRDAVWAADMEYAEEVSIDGTTYNGIITSDFASDYYKFILDSSGCITLRATAEIEWLAYYIYDDFGNEVWKNDYVRTNYITGKSNTEVMIDLTEGTYYFSVIRINGEGEHSFKMLFSSAEESFTETTYEMNNSIDQASSIALNTQYKGQIAENDTEDYYKFTLESSGQINLMVTAGIEWHEYYIFDVSGNEVWKKEYVRVNNNTGKSNTEVTVDLIKGTYYFAVRRVSGTGNYSFKLEYSSAEESFTETASDMNNSMERASSISLDTEYKGQIAENDMEDFYKFTLESSGRIDLMVIAGIEWHEYYIFDTSGNEVWKKEYVRVNNNTGQSNTEEGVNLIKGTYYFAVRRVSGTGNYFFKLGYSSAEESFTETVSKTNNAMDTANSISLGTEYKGQIAKNDPKDYYKFTLNSSGQIKLVAIAEIEWLEYYIFDALGNEVWKGEYVRANSTTGKSDTQISVDLAKGTYYFLVNEGSGTGNYSFRITKYIGIPIITSIQNAASGVKIKWSSVPDATGYSIYRRTGSGEWEKVKTMSSTSWTDTKANINGTQYAYKVYAYNTDAVSDISEYYYEQIYYLTVPEISSIENTAAGKVTVKWAKNTKATGYQVKYKTGSTSKTVTVYSYKTVKKVISKLKKGTKYNICIRAYYQPESLDIKYYSAWSIVESILIKK